jgi:histidyl-tRNA synthetase
MYTFADRGDRSVTLRPEGTAGVMRAVIEHGLDRGALPVKLCYAGPFFRYERPQAGRYRQLQQVGIEAIGVDDPALDAEVIAIADGGFRALGLDGFRLEITSLGDDTCRPQYRQLLQEFLFGLDLDEDTRRRAELNPLRVLDDKRPHMRELTADAPSCSTTSPASPGTLRDGAGAPGRPRGALRGQPADGARTGLLHQDHFRVRPRRAGRAVRDRRRRTLRRVDARTGGTGPLRHRVRPRVDRTMLALLAEGKTAGDTTRCEVFAVPLGEPAKLELAKLAAALRAAGVRVDLAYGDRALKGAMRAADRSGARVALVAGDRDVEAGTVGVKDLSTGEQVDVAADAVLAEVLARLA